MIPEPQRVRDPDDRCAMGDLALAFAALVLVALVWGFLTWVAV